MRIRNFAFAALLATISSSVLAQSASGAGSMTVLRPLTVTKNADLRFGTVVRPSTGSGTAVVSNASVRSVTGGVVGVASGTTPGAAQFTLSGEGAQSVSVTVPATFNIVNAADTVAVTTTNDMIGSAATQTLSGAIGSAGTLVVNVGGSVTIASTELTGLYTGSFTVSAAYN